MGTSAANKGSPSGVPLVPDWVPAVPPPAPPLEPTPPEEEGNPQEPPFEDDEPEQDDSTTPSPPQSGPLAPPRRYHGARTCIGKFATSGNKEDLRSSLKHFVSTGSGGARAAARRLGATSLVVGRAYDIISNLSSTAPDSSKGLSAKDLQGCSASEVKSRVIEAIQPLDGTQDTESVRQSLNWAMNEMLKLHEEANLTQLATEQFDTLISGFISHEVYSHFMLEVGETLFARSGDRGVERANDILSYIRTEVQRICNDNNGRLTNRGSASHLARTVLEKTFRVFEEYIHHENQDK